MIAGATLVQNGGLTKTPWLVPVPYWHIRLHEVIIGEKQSFPEIGPTDGYARLLASVPSVYYTATPAGGVFYQR